MTTRKPRSRLLGVVHWIGSGSQELVYEYRGEVYLIKDRHLGRRDIEDQHDYEQYLIDKKLNQPQAIGKGE